MTTESRASRWVGGVLAAFAVFLAFCLIVVIVHPGAAEISGLAVVRGIAFVGFVGIEAVRRLLPGSPAAERADWIAGACFVVWAATYLPRLWT